MSAPSAQEPPQTPAQSSTQTCTGSLGITCDIDENLDIVRTGCGTLFRRRLKDLVESYLPQIETPWRYKLMCNTHLTQYAMLIL